MTRPVCIRRGSLLLALLAAAVAAVPVCRADEPVARLRAGGSLVEWQPLVDYENILLKVGLPDRTVTRTAFAAGETPVFGLFDGVGRPLFDGVYKYELVVLPRPSPEARAALAAARGSGDEAGISALRASGQLAEPAMQSGTFAIRGGSFVVPAAATGSQPAAPQLVLRDQVIDDDLIVTGSACVGPGCADGESFGTDTLRLKGEVVRLKGDQLPFRISPGAPSSSLTIAANGNVGLGTASPGSRLHVLGGDIQIYQGNLEVHDGGILADGDVRAEVSTNGGFIVESEDDAVLPQLTLAKPNHTWRARVISNGHFALSDATSGVTPFRIVGNAGASDRLVIASDGVNVTGTLRVNGTAMAGFDGSRAFRLSSVPWLEAASPVYEDWYFLAGSQALDPLNEAAVTGPRRQPHEEVARLAGAVVAGLYRLRRGSLALTPAVAHWVAKPPGETYEAFYGRFTAGAETQFALWGRQMVLGPTPEFSLHVVGLGESPPVRPAVVCAIEREWLFSQPATLPRS